MINFTLIFWIVGCSGPNCPIESHELEPYITLELCLEARDEKRENPRAPGFPYAAHCLDGVYLKEQSDE